MIEVKHWTSQWFDLNQYEVEGEADRIAMKAKKVANTLGSEPTVSQGIVSALRDGLIQTDAPVNPGNSGVRC